MQKALNKVNGKPFRIVEIEEALKALALGPAETER